MNHVEEMNLIATEGMTRKERIRYNGGQLLAALGIDCHDAFEPAKEAFIKIYFERLVLALEEHDYDI